MVGDGELRDQVEEMIHNFDMDSSFLITFVQSMPCYQ